MQSQGCEKPQPMAEGEQFGRAGCTRWSGRARHRLQGSRALAPSPMRGSSGHLCPSSRGGAASLRPAPAHGQAVTIQSILRVEPRGNSRCQSSSVWASHSSDLWEAWYLPDLSSGLPVCSSGLRVGRQGSRLKARESPQGNMELVAELRPEPPNPDAQLGPAPSP